ncbi:MAG: signal peptidase I [bacterium]
MSSLRKRKKRARRCLADLKTILKRARKKGADSEDIKTAQELQAKLKTSLKSKDPEEISAHLSSLEEFVDRRLSRYRPNQAWEVFKGIVIAVAIALFIRWMFVETFRIPSGSMIPTLLIGDQLVVNKLAFGPSFWVPYVDPPMTDQGIKEILKKGSPRFSFQLAGHNIMVVSQKLWQRRLPRRGEVVVFLYPRDPRHPYDSQESYIKRVIGLPGDKVELKKGKLYVNGKEVPLKKLGPYNGPTDMRGSAEFDLYRETLENSEGKVNHKILHRESWDSTSREWRHGSVTVPPGKLYVMGDNRDCSSDSREWGFVPVSHLKGSALFIHLPLNPDNYYLPRWDRFFQPIN